jgi:hypothetical protein
MTDHLYRWVVTKPVSGAPNYRQLFGPCQGRFTHATQEEAQAWCDLYLKNNSESKLNELGRDVQPRLVRCYPGHFDPVQVYFKEDNLETVQQDPLGPQKSIDT